MIVKILAGWTIAAFFVFVILELTIPAGSQLKKWPSRALLIFYIPLYAIGAVLYVLVELWNFRPRKMKEVEEP